MNETVKLKLFSRAIDRQAEAEMKALAEAARERKAAAGRVREERAAKEAMDEINAESARIEAAFRKEISKCDFDMKKQVLAYRGKLIEDFFADIERGLEEFAQSPEYDKYLSRALGRVEAELGAAGGDGAVTIYARKCDIDRLQRLTKYEIVPDSGIRLGGICAKLGGLFSDATLDSALTREKEAFADKAELRL